MGRSPCCSKESMNRGAWTALEDKILINYVNLHGEGRWKNLPQKAGLKRCGKSCRLRWMNYLRPGIKRGNISPDEEDLIIRLHKLLGNRWSLIAGRLPGRTDNEIKNYWNTNLAKKLQQVNHQKPTSTITKAPSDPTPPPPTVVRVKAVKCTKVFLNQALATNDVVDKVLMTQHSSDIVAASRSQIYNQFDTDQTLVGDLDFDDLFLSDILMNEDFNNGLIYCDNFNDGINEVDLAEEQQNMGPNFNSFASLFHDGASEGQWFEAD